MASFPMTPRGQQLLKDELKRLREVERPKNVRDIEEARAHGDLKENAEYHAAKERQGFIEGRSREIEAVLAQAEVIDPAKLSGTKVVFGATVKLTDTDSGDEVTYTIVGDYEGDIKEKRIAISAPLARAMIGREQGETVSRSRPARARASTRSRAFGSTPSSRARGSVGRLSRPSRPRPARRPGRPCRRRPGTQPKGHQQPKTYQKKHPTRHPPRGSRELSAGSPPCTRAPGPRSCHRPSCNRSTRSSNRCPARSAGRGPACTPTAKRRRGNRRRARGRQHEENAWAGVGLPRVAGLVKASRRRGSWGTFPACRSCDL